MSSDQQKPILSPSNPGDPTIHELPDVVNHPAHREHPGIFDPNETLTKLLEAVSKTHERLGRLIAILLTVLIVGLPVGEAILQHRQSEFERQERALELTTGIGNQWRETFDSSSRYLYAQVYNAFKMSNGTDQTRFMHYFSKEENISKINKSWLDKDVRLKNLLNADAGEVTAKNVGMRLSDYRAVLLQTLNLYETIAIARRIAREAGHHETLCIIEDKYWTNIASRMNT